MKDQSHTDRLQSLLDEADRMVEALDSFDAALGAYLLRRLAEPDHPSRHVLPVGSPGWYRARIQEWCRSPSVWVEFTREAAESTHLAVPELDDEELGLLVADLVQRGATLPEVMPAGPVSIQRPL